jgi:hypothetical protein
MAAGQPKRVLYRRGHFLPPGARLVARPTKWGNPYRVGVPVPRESPLFPYLAQVLPTAGFMSVTPLRHADVVHAYGWWFIEQPPLMIAVQEELGGHDLACYCHHGQPCHADFLLAMANPGTEIP